MIEEGNGTQEETPTGGGGTGDVPVDPIQMLREQAEAEFREFMESVGGQRKSLDAALAEIERDASEAIEAGDVEHLKALRHELPAILTRAGVQVRERNADRILRLGSHMLSALYGVIARRLAVVALLVLAASGCALMHRGMVPSDGVRGLVGEVCSVADDCVEDGRIPGPVPTCMELEAALDSRKSIEAGEMATALADICASVDTCLAQWDDLPDYRRRSYRRWCATLQETAASALAR